jgi:hypothetical protein
MAQGPSMGETKRRIDRPDLPGGDRDADGSVLPGVRLGAGAAIGLR